MEELKNREGSKVSHQPTVVFDFDGVIHSYKSGWKGAGVIPDPIVPGMTDAIDQLREHGYIVVVVSTRCSTQEGMEAVKTYLMDNGIIVDDVLAEKPPAVCYIDDRAICFDGHPESLPRLVESFVPWHQVSDEVSDEQSILKKAITTWGAGAQMIMVCEEMSELQKELCKNLRGSDNKMAIAEEIADVEIMLDQMKILFGIHRNVAVCRSQKIERLAGRLEAARNV